MVKCRIPYGQSDYKSIKKEKNLYVDKTSFIEKLEQSNSKFPVFLRPRRFGKSLLVSTLYYYYDRNSAAEFATLFGDTYIGSHKTALANQYYVLRFDFSGLSTDSREQLQIAFYRKIITALKRFVRYYDLEIKIAENDQFNAASVLDAFLAELAAVASKSVYIMIDEYDHFANNIIGNQEFFRSITSKDGFVRSFYEVFKTHTGDGCIDRIFITGVTSMTLDSLTSGFNIARNISLTVQFNEMVGFTEAETKGLLKKIGVQNVDGILTLLVEYYNGYLFHSEQLENQRVLNSDLVMFFLDEYQRLGRLPKAFIDANIRSDYQKLTAIFDLFPDEETRAEILQDIMKGKSIGANIVANFSFSPSFSREEFLSMLFYLGLLTIEGAGGSFDVMLKPPNAVFRDVYYSYYSDYLRVDTYEKYTALDEIAFAHNFDKFNEMIIKIMKLHSTDDYRGFDEARLKSVFLASLCNQNLYLVKSEYQSEGRKIDIALLDPRNGETSVKYNYLIELKYLKRAEATAENIASAIQKAREQMADYLSLEEFQKDGRMKGLIYVVSKDEIVCFEEIKHGGLPRSGGCDRIRPGEIRNHPRLELPSNIEK